MVQERPIVSVALCTCNGGKFIVEQIESILSQSLPPCEVVIHDDASTDDTVQLIQQTWNKFAEQGAAGVPELRLTVNKRRLGVAGNFMSALSVCQGRLIALADQDDRWPENRLERMASRMAVDPAILLLHSNARLVNESGQDMGLTLFDALGATPGEINAIAAGNALDVLLDRNLVTGASVLMRRELLSHALPIPHHWLHDEWLGAIAAALGGLTVEPQRLLDYRQHGNNQIGARPERLSEALSRALQPRGDWHERRVLRASELECRLRLLGSLVPEAALHAVTQKVAHHQARAGLPRNRGRRIVPIVREWSTGRYKRFGRGLRGAFKDLLEPA